jgi:hypothetical protein
MSYMKMAVPQHVYDRRLERMAWLIQAKAPAIIIYHEARLIERAYRPNLWHRITHVFISSRVGLWCYLLPEWIKYKLTGKSDFYNLGPLEEIVEEVEEDLYGQALDLASRRLGVSPEEVMKMNHDNLDKPPQGLPSCPECRCPFGNIVMGCHCVCHD